MAIKTEIKAALSELLEAHGRFVLILLLQGDGAFKPDNLAFIAGQLDAITGVLRHVKDSMEMS